MSDHDLSELGPLSKGAINVFSFAKRLAPLHWLPVKPRSELLQHEVSSIEFTKKRAKAVEYYMLVYLLVEILISALVCLFDLPTLLAFVAAIIVSLKIIEILQVTINTTVFDQLRRPDNRVASSPRMVVLAFINLFELCTCFGVLYALDWHHLHGAGRAATAFYFSVITMLTIGYGDVYPTGWYLRSLTAFQGLAGLTFIILVFARLVASLPRIGAILDPESPHREAQQHNEGDGDRPERSSQGG